MVKQMNTQTVENSVEARQHPLANTGSLSDTKAQGVISGYTVSFEPASTACLERREVAILYADIVDYARLMEQDEEASHLRVIACLSAIQGLIQLYGGRVAHMAGDAILAEFTAAASALRCAISFQLAARQWNAALGSDEQIRFRVGINYGEVFSDHGDIYGQAVNLAARLEGLASSGGICVSQALRENLEGQSQFKFIDLGKRYLKNIAKPVEVFWICYCDPQSDKHKPAGIRSALNRLFESFGRLSGLLPFVSSPGLFSHSNTGD